MQIGMSANYTKAIQQRIGHNDVKQYLNSLGISPTRYYMTNCRRLSQALAEKGFTGDITNENIRQFINRLHPQPTGQIPLGGGNELLPGIQPEEVPQPQPQTLVDSGAKLRFPLQSKVPKSEQSTDQKQHDDELFAKLKAQNDKLKAENERLEARNKRLTRMMDDLTQQTHENAIMNMGIFPDTRTKLSTEERVLRRAIVIDEVTDGLVTTVATEDDYKRNSELVRFIQRHKPERIESPDGFIPLFTVDDDNQAAFQSKVTDIYNKNGKEHNCLKVDLHGDYFLYYINNLSSMKALFDTLESVYDKHKDSPFKIMCDSGFILEQHDSDSCSYKYQPPAEMVSGRSIPMTITERHDLELYKHYIYSYITEKTELTHENSRNRYCAIVSFMFKVVPLQRTGKRTSKIRFAPEYEWLLHDNNIEIIDCQYNICVFNCIAAGVLEHERHQHEHSD